MGLIDKAEKLAEKLKSEQEEIRKNRIRLELGYKKELEKNIGILQGVVDKIFNELDGNYGLVRVGNSLNIKNFCWLKVSVIPEINSSTTAMIQTFVSNGYVDWVEDESFATEEDINWKAFKTKGFRSFVLEKLVKLINEGF